MDLPRRRFGRRRWSARRIAVATVLGVACLLTMLCLVLLVALWRIDRAIETRTGRTTAEVTSVSWNRTVVRYTTPNGSVHIPATGVFYPMGLATSQLVRVEYDTAHPDTVRVAGRTADLALLPVGMTVGGVWLVAGPAAWWITRRRPTP